MSVMICSRANNLYKKYMRSMECLIKLSYPIRSNLNNIKFAVVSKFCRQEKKTMPLQKKKTEKERERGKGGC